MATIRKQKQFGFKSRFMDNAGDIMLQYTDLVDDDFDDAKDRAHVSAFYNGMETIDPEEAKKQGVRDITNHLFGYEGMNTAYSQIMNLYSAPPNIWSIRSFVGNANERERNGRLLTECQSRVIRRSGRLKEEWRQAAGDMILHGRAILGYRGPHDWCPTVMNLYVPRQTPTVPEEVPYAMEQVDISLRQLYEWRQMAKRKDSPFKMDVLNDLIEGIEKHGARNPAPGSDAEPQAFDQVEIEAQEGTHYSEKATHPVVYYYEVDMDDEDLPVDLRIVSKWSMGKETTEDLIFEARHYFDHIREWIHPFFVDTNLGGRSLWHRVQGLGKMNLDSDVDVELLFNELMEGARENARRFWRILDSADRESVIRWMSENSNLIPEGVDIVEFQKNLGFEASAKFMEALRQNSATKAGTHFRPTSGENNRELEVQALERQANVSQVMTTRMSDIRESLGKLGEEILRRFIHNSLSGGALAKRDIRAFRDDIERVGLTVNGQPMALEDLGEYESNYGFIHLDVKPTNDFATGSRTEQTIANQNMMQRLPLYDPKARRTILRRVTAIENQDWELANELVPEIVEKPGDQVARANSENSAAFDRGILGYVPEIKSGDLHEIHVEEHFGGLDSKLAKGEVSGWEQTDAAGFDSLMQHTTMHVDEVRGTNPQLANDLMQNLEGKRRQAAKYITNMQREQEAGEVSPADRHKMAVDEEKLRLAQRTQNAIEADRDRKHRLAEEKFAADEVDKASGENLQRDQMLTQREIEAARLAMQNRQRQEEEPASASNGDSQ